MRDLRRVWLLLAAGPALFLVAIVVVSVVLGMRGVAPEQIGQRVPLLMPHMLLGVLACLGVLTAIVARGAGIWTLAASNKRLADVGIGLFVGVVVAFLYLIGLAPLLEAVQRNIGDYVPPGAVLPTVSSNLGLFFLANVVLAPLVEETLYRGYALTRLAARLGDLRAVVITCLCFGALHWPGGLWYMVLTGVVAGGAFAGLALWRRGILAPFAAHFALNLVEFVAAWRGA